MDPRHLAIGVGVVVSLFAVAVWLLLFRDPGVEPQEEVEAPVTVERSLSSPAVEPASETEEDEAQDVDEESADARPPATIGRTLRITQSGVGTDVVDRNLVGRSDRFPEGSRVHFWTRVVGGEDGDRIWHVWTHADGTYVRAELRVGGAHWRTHSSFVLPHGSAGEWVLEVKDPDGVVIARETFVAVSPDGT